MYNTAARVPVILILDLGGFCHRQILQRVGGILHRTCRARQVVVHALLHRTCRARQLVVRALLHRTCRARQLVVRALLHRTCRARQVVVHALLHRTCRARQAVARASLQLACVVECYLAILLQLAWMIECYGIQPHSRPFCSLRGWLNAMVFNHAFKSDDVQRRLACVVTALCT